MKNVGILRSAAREEVSVCMVWLPRRSSQLQLNHTILPYALLSSSFGLSPGVTRYQEKANVPVRQSGSVPIHALLTFLGAFVCTDSVP